MVACDDSNLEIRDQLIEGRNNNPRKTPCTKRLFADLDGFLDLDLVSTNGLESVESKVPVGCTICSLRPAPEQTQFIVEAMR